MESNKTIESGTQQRRWIYIWFDYASEWNSEWVKEDWVGFAFGIRSPERYQGWGMRDKNTEFVKTRVPEHLNHRNWNTINT